MSHIRGVKVESRIMSRSSPPNRGAGSHPYRPLAAAPPFGRRAGRPSSASTNRRIPGPWLMATVQAEGILIPFVASGRRICLGRGVALRNPKKQPRAVRQQGRSCRACVCPGGGCGSGRMLGSELVQNWAPGPVPTCRSRTIAASSPTTSRRFSRNRHPSASWRFPGCVWSIISRDPPGSRASSSMRTENRRTYAIFIQDGKIIDSRVGI